MPPYLVILRRIAALFLGLSLLSLAQADSALRNMQGYITTLDEYQVPGQWTVVMIWASDCPICNRESGQYSRFYTEHNGKDVNLVGISIDGYEEQGKADAQAFIDRNKVLFPSLIGDLQTVAQWYQGVTGQEFRATPTFVVFGPDGKVRAAQLGAVPVELILKFIASNS